MCLLFIVSNPGYTSTIVSISHEYACTSTVDVICDHVAVPESAIQCLR